MFTEKSTHIVSLNRVHIQTSVSVLIESGNNVVRSVYESYKNVVNSAVIQDH